MLDARRRSRRIANNEPDAKAIFYQFQLKSFIATFHWPLLAFLFFAVPTMSATEDPPNCSLANGGLGNTSQGGINFTVAQAHVGDTVTLIPSLGMAAGACRAINATGSVWIATGRLTNFLINVTLDPGPLVTCPGDPSGKCQPGPYSFLLTPALVGSGVNSLNGAVAGVPKVVWAVQNGNGTVQTGVVGQQLGDFHTATIAVVTPCIQVVHQSAYPQGQTCFSSGQPINFTGSVVNCGDIRLTNVVVTANRTGTLLGTNGLPLFQPLALDSGQAIAFQGSYSPTAQDISSGAATNTAVVSGTDTTAIGGSAASVANNSTVVSLICALPTITSQPVSQTVAAGSNATFSVTATGTMPLNYRWRFNGTNLASATSATLTVTNVQPTNAGNYSVLVSNAFGTATSSNAALTVDATIRLSSYLWTTNGFQFRLTGPAGTYAIQSSTNLSQTNWTVLTNLVVTQSPYLFVDVSAPPAPYRFYRAVALNQTNSPPPVNMALIPAGNFTMGDTLDGDAPALPVHTNYVSAFYMDQYLVTKTLWDNVYNWAIAHGYSFDHPGSGKAAAHPTLTVSWLDCVKWCNARSEQEGRTPAYYTEAAQTNVFRTGQTNVQNDWVKWDAGYRLPTEAEWEKAARGGASGHRFPWADTDEITHSRANYYSKTNYLYDTSFTRGYNPTFINGSIYTSPVGYFAANGYGLYDMAGNVAEWCWDWYATYASGSQTDPRGPTSGSYRAHRSGGWSDDAFNCRSVYRIYHSPTYAGNTLGFRSVLPPGQ